MGQDDILHSRTVPTKRPKGEPRAKGKESRATKVGRRTAGALGRRATHAGGGLRIRQRRSSIDKIERTGRRIEKMGAKGRGPAAKLPTSVKAVPLLRAQAIEKRAFGGVMRESRNVTRAGGPGPSSGFSRLGKIARGLGKLGIAGMALGAYSMAKDFQRARKPRRQQM